MYTEHDAPNSDVNPESIKQKFGDLGAAGGSLGKFYSSLASAQ